MATVQSQPALPLFSGLRAPTSFSAHRQSRALDEDGDDSTEPTPAPSPESVDAAPAMTEQEHEHAGAVYRIPQRTGRMPTAPPPTPVTSVTSRGRGPPRPLSLSGTTKAVSDAPLTAPVRSRISAQAAARGISIDVTSGKNASRGLSTGGGGRRWPTSPGKTPTSASFPRTRGLTVAILRGDGEVVAESAPMTPGALKTPSQQAQPQLTPPRTLALELVSSSAVPDADLAPATPRVHQKILCRYYHTPGMTCTSSPCRFVHKIDHSHTPVPTTAPYSAIPRLSPRKNLDSPDPTSGTFAAAQATAPLPAHQPQLLQIDGDVSGITAGEAVSVVNEDGGAHLGFVYKLSGGGKGPGGKSRSKYRTVPCKDYATGTCAYGTYCSFIHDDNNLYDEAVHGKKRTEDDNKTKAAQTKDNGVDNNIPQSCTPRTPTSPSYATVASTTKSKAKADDWPQLAETASSPGTNINEVTVLTSTSASAPRISDPPRRPRNLKIVKKAEHARFEAPAPAAPPSVSPIIETPMTEASDPAAAWDPAVQHATVQQGAPPAKLETSAGGDAQADVPFPHNPGYPWSPEWSGGWQMYPAVDANGNVVGTDVQLTPLTDGYSPQVPFPMSPFDQAAVIPPNGAFMPMSPDPNYPSHFQWAGAPLSPPFPMEGTDANGMPFSQGMVWTPATEWPNTPRYGLGIGLGTPELNYKRQYWRTRPCKFWTQSGGRECPHGDTCCFQHTTTSSPAAARSTRAWSPPARAKTVACKFFNSKEGCTRSDAECPFAHVKVVPEGHHVEVKPFRTRPCRHFQLGRCRLGAECHFAHVLNPAAPKGTAAPPVTPVTPFAYARAKKTRPAHDEDKSCATGPKGSRADKSERSNSAPAASAMHAETLVGAAFPPAPRVACPEWTSTGRCERKWCTAPHDDCDIEGAATLTEERLAAACAMLRAKMSEQSSAVVSDSDDSDDDDELEIVTNTHSRPSTRSSRSV